MRSWLGLLGVVAMPVLAAGDGGSVLVFGGTGRLGLPIVERLVAAGHPVTVFVRPTSDRSLLAHLGVDFMVGDLLDGDSVVTAVAGRPFRFVIDASAKDRDQEGFYDTAMRNILRAIADSKVQQFILHGSVGAGDNVRHFPDVPFGRMHRTLEAKGEAERLLRASGIDYTIIRNGRILSAGSPATGQARLTEDQTILAPVTRPDLAILTMQCLDNPDCMNRIFHAVDESL